MWRSGCALAATNMKVVETLQASQSVVDRRAKTIDSAMRDPLGADYAELARMGPEKVAAFTAAGASAFADVQALQADAFAACRQMFGLAMAGRLPSAAEMTAIVSRSSRMMERAAGAGGKALAPVHRAATGNARRLSKAG
jgi:hypothetical protein